jgi:UDP-2-acetamido-2,6-beta-L-arabino-hexul-4-ose reductase
MRVLITGANGFIGKNLRLRLRERKDLDLVCFTREQNVLQLPGLLQGVDFVFHLAGVNRPNDPHEFVVGNTELTRELCAAVADAVHAFGRRIPIVLTSSIQAELDNPYGRSKREAEEALRAFGCDPLVPVHVFRLPNVFGKWCKPNYNSVVATFCYNIARGLPVTVNDPHALVKLVYVDDVVDRFLQLLDGADGAADRAGFESISPQYMASVGDLSRNISAFKDSRATQTTERVGDGLLRALYATYVSYLPVEAFSYEVPHHADPRGVFVEMLKTPDCGQFSYFTAHPGVTRGGHYHHSKTEKFLVISGAAKFRFRHMQTDEAHEILTTGDRAQVVETVPGWTHDITNVGEGELVVMLWANEVFDRARPDTYVCPL